MVDKQLAALLQKRLACLEINSDEAPEMPPNIPAAPPPPPENIKPPPYFSDEQFADIDKLINDTLRYTESQEVPIWRKQSSVSPINSVDIKSIQPTIDEDSVKSNQPPNPTGKCAPVVPIVHNEGGMPQKPQPSLDARLEKQRKELEEKLAKQRQKKAANPPDVLEGTKSKSFNDPPRESKDIFSPESMIETKNETQNEMPTEAVMSPFAVMDTRVAFKSPPPTPKKPKCPMTAAIQAPLSRACSSTSNRSTCSDEGEELAAKLARRNMIAEGEAVEPAKPPKLSIYTEFHEFSRKQIKYFMETFKRFDEDGDSFIDFNELKRMMEKLGEAQTHVALKGILKLVDEDRDGKVSLREFLLIFRYAATGQLSCSEVFNKLAESIDVTKEGVQGAAGFFQAKIDELSKSSKFEEEIKQEQEERKQLEEQKKERRQNFLANKAVFSN